MNGARGDTPLMLDGVLRPLRLTFGALAEIETALGVVTLEELAARLRKPRASDLMVIIAALLKGGGCADAKERLAKARMNPGAAVRAVATVFRQAFA